jgi:hypothetical protein
MRMFECKSDVMFGVAVSERRRPDADDHHLQYRNTIIEPLRNAFDTRSIRRTGGAGLKLRPASDNTPRTALGWSQPETVQGAGTVLKITGDDYRGRRLIVWIGEVPDSGGALPVENSPANLSACSRIPHRRPHLAATQTMQASSSTSPSPMRT